MLTIRTSVEGPKTKLGRWFRHFVDCCQYASKDPKMDELNKRVKTLQEESTYDNSVRIDIPAMTWKDGKLLPVNKNRIIFGRPDVVKISKDDICNIESVPEKNIKWSSNFYAFEDTREFVSTPSYMYAFVDGETGEILIYLRNVGYFDITSLYAEHVAAFKDESEHLKGFDINLMFRKLILDKDKYAEYERLSKIYRRKSHRRFKVYEFLHTLDSIYLSIRFPFLYPRNRWTDRHYNNWKIMDYVSDLRKKYEIYVNCEIPTDDYMMPVFFNYPDVYTNEDDNTIRCRNMYQGGKYEDYILYKPADKPDKFGTCYPVEVMCDLVIYIPECGWTKLEGYEEALKRKEDDTRPLPVRGALLIKDEEKNVNRYYFTYEKNRYVSLWACIVKWFHDNILSLVFAIPNFNELDDMPEGWRRAFGIQMCREIKQALKKTNFLYKYRITQIKEKFGDLRWYDNGSPNGVVNEIVDKYESLSARTCICCGRPARFITRGWISPYCENCLTEEGQKKADWLDENGNYIKNPNDKKEDEVQNKVGDEPKEESTE